MRMKKLMLIFATLCFSGSPVSAASLDTANLEMKISPREVEHYKKITVSYSKAYKEFADEVYKGTVDHARIKSMRAYYPQTTEYTPFSESIINRMTGFAYIADTSSDLGEVNDALDEYRKLLREHIVNFDILSFALTLARADVRYGDEIMLNQIRKHIIEDLTGMYNVGKTPDRAYTIATYGEETFILEQLNANVISSELFKVGRSFYNVHEIETPNGDVRQIYMNVTGPIRNVRLRQIVRDQQERLTIPGQ